MIHSWEVIAIMTQNVSNGNTWIVQLQV